MSKKINLNNFNLDDNNNNNKSNSVDYLLDKKTSDKHFDDLQNLNKQEQNVLNINVQNNFELLNTINNFKRTTDKKMYQIYLTKEIIAAVETFMRRNGITKKTDAFEMLLRFALNLPQIK